MITLVCIKNKGIDHSMAVTYYGAEYGNVPSRPLEPNHSESFSHSFSIASGLAKGAVKVVVCSSSTQVFDLKVSYGRPRWYICTYFLYTYTFTKFSSHFLFQWELESSLHKVENRKQDRKKESFAPMSITIVFSLLFPTLLPGSVNPQTIYAHCLFPKSHQILCRWKAGEIRVVLDQSNPTGQIALFTIQSDCYPSREHCAFQQNYRGLT